MVGPCDQLIANASIAIVDARVMSNGPFELGVGGRSFKLRFYCDARVEV